MLGRTALCDIDGDGGSDIVFYTYSGALFVLDGGTGSPMAIFNSGSHGFATPIVIDMNGDRAVDILCGTYGGEVFAIAVSDVRRSLFSLKHASWGARNHDYRNSGYAQAHFLKNPWM